MICNNNLHSWSSHWNGCYQWPDRRCSEVKINPLFTMCFCVEMHRPKDKTINSKYEGGCQQRGAPDRHMSNSSDTYAVCCYLLFFASQRSLHYHIAMPNKQTAMKESMHRHKKRKEIPSGGSWTRKKPCTLPWTRLDWGFVNAASSGAQGIYSLYSVQLCVLMFAAFLSPGWSSYGSRLCCHTPTQTWGEYTNSTQKEPVTRTEPGAKHCYLHDVIKLQNEQNWSVGEKMVNKLATVSAKTYSICVIILFCSQFLTSFCIWIKWS